MLTREQFAKLLENRLENADAINQAYVDATPAEQKQYIEWLEQVIPPETPDEDAILGEAGEVLGDDYAREQDEAETAIDEAVRKIMEQAATSVTNPRELAASKRSQRSNMLRSIRAKYRLMEEFSITECARRIGRDPAEVSAYLISEIKRGTGTFTYLAEKNKFMLDNPFA